MHPWGEQGWDVVLRHSTAARAPLVAVRVARGRAGAHDGGADAPGAVRAARRAEEGDMTTTPVRPRLVQTVLDTTDPRRLAEFYRELLGMRYRDGDETTDPDGDDWLVLTGDGCWPLAFQKVPEITPPTWPDPAVPQQLHLDMTVPDAAALDEAHLRVLGLGARLLLDRRDDPDEPLYVYADPDGHPFCVFVG